MPYIRIGTMAVVMLFVVVLSIHGGYQMGVSAENSTELNQSIREVQTNFSDIAEENLTANYSEMNDTTDREWLRPVEKTYYNTAVKPAYWIGRNALEWSGIIMEATARATYRHL